MNLPLRQKGQCASAKKWRPSSGADHQLKWMLMLLPASHLAFGAGAKSMVDKDSVKELADMPQRHSNCCTSALNCPAYIYTDSLASLFHSRPTSRLFLKITVFYPCKVELVESQSVTSVQQCSYQRVAMWEKLSRKFFFSFTVSAHYGGTEQA